MKKNLLFAAVVLACGIASCKKDSQVKSTPKSAVSTALQSNAACPAPPAIIGVISTGGISADAAYFVNISPSGNVIIDGRFDDVVNFDPADVFNLQATDKKNSYKQVLRPNGTLISAENTGLFIEERVWAPVDAQGNSYSSRTQKDPVSGIRKVIVTKYRANGNEIWYADAGTTTFKLYAPGFLGHSKLDKNGNLLFSNPDGIIYVFSPSGSLLKTFEHEEINASVFVDNLGNVYIFGQTGWLMKYTKSGTLVWKIRNTSIGKSPEIKAITVDSEGNVYTTGIFYESTDLDPGPGVSLVLNNPAKSEFSMFVQKLSSSGKFEWALQTQKRGTETEVNYIKPSDIAIDPTDENVVVVGNYRGAINFNPGGTINATSKGGTDAFTLGIKQCK